MDTICIYIVTAYSITYIKDTWRPGLSIKGLLTGLSINGSTSGLSIKGLLTI